MDESDIVIVGEPNDLFAEAFCAYANSKGVVCRRFSYESFAREVTLEHEEGKIRIYPECGLLLRPLSGPYASDEESRFRRGEEFAAVWSTAALSSKPVINRANEWGISGRLAFSAALTDLRLTNSSHGPEAFWHDAVPCNPEPAKGRKPFHQDLTTWRTIADPRASSYVRSRWFPDCCGWEQVVVVARDGYRVTAANLRQWDVVPESIRAAAALGLQFATVSWGIPTDGSRPLVSRINPFPTIYECGPVFRDVAQMLLERLRS